jgi:iron(III) transport system permease protein
MIRSYLTRHGSHLVFGLMVVFFSCFFVYPIYSTMKVAFTGVSGQFTFAYVIEVFANDLYRAGLINSLWMAIWSTLGCLLVAVPLASCYVRYDFPGKGWLNSLMLLPMILPPFVGAIGIKAIFGQAGAVNSALIAIGIMDANAPVDWLGQGQMFGIVVMNVLHLYPILYLNVSAALANLDPALEEAAANLGCSPRDIFRRVTLPLIMPGIFAGGTITFIWAFTELGVPLVFDYERVTSVQIFNALKDIHSNPFPYAMVFVLLVITSGIYALSKLVFEREGRGAGGGRATTARSIEVLHGKPGLAVMSAFIALIGLAIMPHVGVILLSFSTDWYASVFPEGLTLGHYHQVLGHELTLRSIGNSLKYSAIATFLDVVIGVAVAFVVVRTQIRGRHLLDAMAMLPLAVPGLVMAFGYLSMSRPGQPFHFLMLGENPIILLVIAYSVRRLPYVVRSATAGLQQVSISLEEAAQNLGADPARSLWRITLPLVAPNLIAGGLLAFSFAMLEVSDSMILAQQSVHYPITKAIYSLIGALGTGPSLAAALGVWAMVFLGLTMMAAGMILGKKMGALFKA